MKIDKQVLQTLLDSNGEYFVVQRHTSGWKEGSDEWKAVFISPSIPRDLWGAKIGELPYDAVEQFANTDIMTNIYLGSDYPPFQYGLRYCELNAATKVTCNPNELIHLCHTQKLSDYYKILEVMAELTEDEKPL